MDENVDDIDYKVEIIKGYVDEFIESDDVIQIEVKDGEYYINDYGLNHIQNELKEKDLMNKM